MQLTMIATARQDRALVLPDGFMMKAPAPDDAERIGRLYYEAHAGKLHGCVDEAIEETRQAFAGEFGELWPEASGVVKHGDAIVAALFSVHRAPWPDTPDCPFITDLFTDLRFRQRGLARALLSRCLAQVTGTARPTVALRVESENEPAMRLYESFGFCGL